MWIILKAHNNKGALLMWPVVTAQLSYSVERKDSLVFSVCLHLLCHSHDVKGWKGNSNLAVFSEAIVVVETHHLIFLTLWWREPELYRAPTQCVCVHCVFTRLSRLPRVVLLPRVLLCLTWHLFTLFSPALSCPELHLIPVFFSKPDLTLTEPDRENWFYQVVSLTCLTPQFGVFEFCRLLVST